MPIKNQCPVCNGEDLKVLTNSRVPVLQNRVYDDAAAARASAQGDVALTYCGTCQFVFNGSFDNGIVIYDQSYDNSVPSAIFKAYYARIADYLYEKYALGGKTVYDVGCGKGTFLELLCGKYPDVNGIGIDPSYEGETDPQPNLRFIKDFFHEDQISAAPDLVLSRHVFEHIEYPAAFLQIIQDAVKAYRNIPYFIEVPDFGWIIRNQTFWDICYEHCNYFSPASVHRLVSEGGASLSSVTPAFDDQYMWIEGLLNAEPASGTTDAAAPLNTAEMDRFAASVNRLRSVVAGFIGEARADGSRIVLWGMATKGVIFSNLVDPDRRLIDYCIDVNGAKQQKYTPVSGHRILPPESLAEAGQEKLLVIVMNPVYLEEIRRQAGQYSANCQFIDAHGKPLPAIAD